MEMIIDGWQVDRLHYAEDSALGEDDAHVPAAFVELVRPDQGRYGIVIPDDGRALSHRALISMFRECPHIWKHRGADRIHQMAADVPMATPFAQPGWTEVVDPFPGALVFSPGTLRGVDVIDQVQAAGQMTLAITSLERYRDGARARFMVQAPEARKRKQLQLLDVHVRDDLGRTYTTAVIDGHHDQNRVEGALVIGPGVPADAHEVVITVGAVGDPRHRDEAAAGPWEFPVQLGHPLPAGA